jgi:hypothetical protein
MTVIKNHFEIFLVTSKKQGNGVIESKVGLYSTKATSHIPTCQLNVSCGQDYVSGIVHITVGVKKNGNCQNKTDTFLQFFHSVKPFYER